MWIKKEHRNLKDDLKFQMVIFKEKEKEKTFNPRYWYTFAKNVVTVIGGLFWHLHLNRNYYKLWSSKILKLISIQLLFDLDHKTLLVYVFKVACIEQWQCISLKVDSFFHFLCSFLNNPLQLVLDKFLSLSFTIIFHFVSWCH